MQPSAGAPETELLNVSLLPGSPSALTLTLNVQGVPLLTHVPANVAVLPETENELNDTLCIFAPVVRLTYCRSPWIGAPATLRWTVKPKLPIFPAAAIEPPPVI